MRDWFFFGSSVKIINIIFVTVTQTCNLDFQSNSQFFRNIWTLGSGIGVKFIGCIDHLEMDIFRLCGSCTSLLNIVFDQPISRYLYEQWKCLQSNIIKIRSIRKSWHRLMGMAPIVCGMTQNPQSGKISIAWSMEPMDSTQFQSNPKLF